jgi:hypothetical protein
MVSYTECRGAVDCPCRWCDVRISSEGLFCDRLEAWMVDRGWFWSVDEHKGADGIIDMRAVRICDEYGNIKGILGCSR